MYTGGWQNDMKHGLGRKDYATGDVYEASGLTGCRSMLDGMLHHASCNLQCLQHSMLQPDCSASAPDISVAQMASG